MEISSEELGELRDEHEQLMSKKRRYYWVGLALSFILAAFVWWLSAFKIGEESRFFTTMLSISIPGVFMEFNREGKSLFPKEREANRRLERIELFLKSRGFRAHNDFVQGTTLERLWHEARG